MTNEDSQPAAKMPENANDRARGWPQRLGEQVLNYVPQTGRRKSDEVMTLSARRCQRPSVQERSNRLPFWRDGRWNRRAQTEPPRLAQVRHDVVTDDRTPKGIELRISTGLEAINEIYSDDVVEF
jgi:hypothetical protein